MHEDGLVAGSIHHQDDFSRPALHHGSLNPLFEVALYLPSYARLEMHEDGLVAGSRVLIIDDMLGTGATMHGACELAHT